jgi:hypothetical protein
VGSFHTLSREEPSLQEGGGSFQTLSREEPSLVEGRGSPSNCEPPPGTEFRGGVNCFIMFS